jgi:hypothetical protein
MSDQLPPSGYKSNYSFERSELRTIQYMCEGDNERFLNILADMFGKSTAKIETLTNEIHSLEARLVEASQGCYYE